MTMTPTTDGDAVGPVTSASDVTGPPDDSDRTRTLLLVVGSGRSGTSVLAGLLSRLRFHVPQPEVVPDVTNPRGFGEPQWVVEFHTRVLRSAKVQVTDARPGAWALAGRRSYEQRDRDTLRKWLSHEFSQADNVLIKDPRLLWFVPLWRTVGEDLGAKVRFVTMLRHPAEVVKSKETWYDAMSNPANRLAGWVNTMLYTERSTRDDKRSYVLFEDLLEDWTLSVARAGKELDLDVLNKARTQEMRDASEVIDRKLHRSKASLKDIPAPDELRNFAQRVWDELVLLADQHTNDVTAVQRRLDEIREDYIEYYEQIEAVAYSSILAAHRYGLRRALRRTQEQDAALMMRAVRKIPPSWRDMIPLSVRRRILRTVRSIIN
ncbi:MAG TPA: hypothetical protein VFZ70_08225 [Euzebyales bacterium]